MSVKSKSAGQQLEKPLDQLMMPALEKPGVHPQNPWLSAPSTGLRKLDLRTARVICTILVI